MFGISKPHHYQDAKRLKRATDAEIRCSPRIAYDRMLQAGRFPVHYSICLFLLHYLSVRCWSGTGWKALPDKVPSWSLLCKALETLNRDVPCSEGTVCVCIIKIICIEKLVWDEKCRL